MFAYYLRLALRSFGRNRILTGLMVLAVALGIGASMTMLTVLHTLSGDPLPGRSATLFHPQLDPRPRNLPSADPEPPDELTWQDATALYRAQAAPAQTMTSANWLPVRQTVPNSPLRMLTTRAATADLFGMFGMRFVYGSGWSRRDDSQRAPVVVLSRKLNDALFGGADSVGKTLTIATRPFRVIGVIDAWNAQPRFYDLNSGAYTPPEELYMPFETWLDLPQDYGYGPMQCWGKDGEAGLHDPKAAQCTWVQYWVELESPAQAADYKAYLENYSAQQRAAGRFQRPNNVRLRNVMQWLDHNEVVPGDVRLQLWLAMGFLLVCLLNTVGLLLAKFLRRSGEIGVRRALGASRGAIFAQCLVEAGAIGLAGGVAGLGLATLGLWAVRQQPASYAKLAHLDPSMLALTFAMAVGASLLAGLLPSWRAIQVAPALQLKS
ncbi:ABC transporter permease [Xanthomonas sp. LMG 12460]|uniref:ABC transporter permease n=2 Tax=unclassified Xanthomonas TaxID=2643310 RepID=UPI001264C68B|nr:ABC transporter permease [Xanthomonas sp. LMG 12460]KAB7778880.1 ABC transporter ATP-binding protein [Xanthomonas sp. LMG 12460]